MKKNAFTLIELLSVIVILAIISLIVVPIVINIISDAKNSSDEQTIDLYMDIVKKTIANENMKVKYDPDECEIQNNGNLICYKGNDILKTSKGLDELKIEMQGKKPEGGTIIINDSKITYQGVVLEGMEYTINNKGIRTSKTYIKPISTTQSYIGYYADVDGNGTVDGIIYADLAFGSRENASWKRSSYTYVAKKRLKKYILSKEEYHTEAYGKKNIISLKSDTTGSSRFYIMSLDNFSTPKYVDPTNSDNNYPAYNNYYWYYNAKGKMNVQDTSIDFGEGYKNTGKIIEIWNKNGIGDGSYEGATQNNKDIWKHIQVKYDDGWYIPSRNEWLAFADYLANKEENPLIIGSSGNFNSIYKLCSFHWTSSLYNNSNAYFIRFYHGDMTTFSVDYGYACVRLGKTF